MNWIVAALVVVATPAIASEPCQHATEAFNYRLSIFKLARERLRIALNSPPPTDDLLAVEADYVVAYNALYAAVDAFTACEKKKAPKAVGSVL